MTPVDLSLARVWLLLKSRGTGSGPVSKGAEFHSLQPRNQFPFHSLLSKLAVIFACGIPDTAWPRCKCSYRWAECCGTTGLSPTAPSFPENGRIKTMNEWQHEYWTVALDAYSTQTIRECVVGFVRG